MEVPDLGTVRVDYVYGGAFYVFVTAADVKVDLDNTPNSEMKAISAKIKGKVQWAFNSTKWEIFVGSMR